MTWREASRGDSTSRDDWTSEVIAFWFGELGFDHWFKAKDEQLDALIRDRFQHIHAACLAAPVETALVSPQKALASVIVLDQFPRNMYRGDARAFASDDLARSIAAEVVARGIDAPLGRDERLFLYLPFEHSESLADQDRAVALIGALGDETYTRYAVAHRDIIVRFGRFPHRNAVLGRSSTEEELAFLEKPGSSF